MGLPKLQSQTSRDRLTFYYVIRNDGKSAGPFTSSEVLQMIADKQISYKNYCWRTGYQDWRPIIATEDFRSEFKGDALVELEFPHQEIPEEVERRFPVSWDRRAQARKDKKIVVTFAKTKVQRISIYEWVFALLFSLGLSYFTVHWTLGELTQQVSQKIEIAQVGSPQRVGFFYSQTPLPSYAVSALLSSPALKQYEGEPIAVEFKGTLSGTGTHLNVGEGQALAIANTDMERFWKAEKHEIDFVYKKPLHVRGHLDFSAKEPTILVSHPGAPIKSSR